MTTPNGDFGTIGLANAGTRLKAVLNNIPAGTSIYVSANRVDYANGNPVAASNGIVARLVQSEEGPFAPVTPAITLEGIPAVQLPVTNGTATAVWEVLRGNPFNFENADFPIWVLATGTSPASVTVNGSYAPTALSDGGVASSTLPLPRFVADAQTARSLFSVGICLQPALRISKSHTGNFTQYQMGATYNVVVTNSGTGPSSGTVTVTETVPPGLTLVSMAGTGWTCAAGGTTCTRIDALGAGASYQPITVTVNVASNAPSQVTNQVGVSGGGSGGANAGDPTTIGAGTCPYSLNPTNAMVASGGGTGMVSVMAAVGCSWAATSNATSWLNVTSGTSGSGSGVVNYSFAANPNPTPRSATITVGAQSFILTQAGIAVAGLRFVPVTPCRIADTRNVNGPVWRTGLGGWLEPRFRRPIEYLWDPGVGCSLLLKRYGSPYRSSRLPRRLANRAITASGLNTEFPRRQNQGQRCHRARRPEWGLNGICHGPHSGRPRHQRLFRTRQPLHRTWPSTLSLPAALPTHGIPLAPSVVRRLPAVSRGRSRCLPAVAEFPPPLRHMP